MTGRLDTATSDTATSDTATTDTATTDTATTDTEVDDRNLLTMDVEAAVAEAAARYSNRGRWGADDVHGTLNFVTAPLRARAAALVRTGTVVSLSQPFDGNGPQHGWRGRINPLHTMSDTGVEAAAGIQGFAHGFGGADDMIVMPLQASTQWDGLGHIFDHGTAWNGRDAATTVTSTGDHVTGIQTAADRMVGRGVLLDVGRVLGTDGELPTGFAIGAAELEATIAAQGTSAQVGTGDFLLVRTGRLARAKRDGWGDYAGGAAAGMSFASVGWLQRHQIAAIATDTWGFEVRPNEFPDAFQPLHQVAIPHLGLYLGEMWDLDDLADTCAREGRWEFLLAAAPIPFTGAVGAPVNPVAIL